MKSNRAWAFNWHQLFFLPIAAVLITGAIVFFTESPIFFGIVLLLAALLFLFGSFTNPLFYAFSSTGITLVYLILPNERYLWKDVESVDAGFIFENGRSFPIFSLPVYEITGTPDSNLYFYMNGYVCKTRRNKRLFEKYWGHEVNGYYDDLKTSFKKHRAKRAKALAEARRKQLEFDILPLERRARAQLRDTVKELTDQAQRGRLALRINYLYVTNKGQETHSRPDESYGYLACAEISRPGETNEHHILTKSVFLVSVHLGKRSVKGTLHQRAKELLYSAVNEALIEIAEKGIDAYIKESEQP